MKSVSRKNWKEVSVSKRLIEKLKLDYKFTELLSKLIINNKFTEEEIFNIENDLEIKNPFMNDPDFKKSYLVLKKNITEKKNICLIGDYDVDGAVATSLFIKFFRTLNIPYYFYIPDRIKDGYGPNVDLINNLLKKKPKLIIMLDCGSNSNDVINFINKKKIDTIIIDHHEIYKPYPRSSSIINPKIKKNRNNYDYFCSGSLSYFFLDYYIKKEKLNFNLENELLPVLFSIIADVMPIKGINKLIAKKILKKKQINENPIIKYIFAAKKINKILTFDDINFLINPILNCSGRIDNSKNSTKLLIEDDNKKIQIFIDNLILINEKRKFIENEIINNINFKELSLDNFDVNIYFIKNIHEGLIGIIASRIKDYLNKPCIVLTNTSKFLKGSARSTSNFNIGKYIKSAIDNNIIINGGGHNLAAGLILKEEKIKQLRDFMSNKYQKYSNQKNYYNYLSMISSSSINTKFYDQIKKAGPFGHLNPNPTFLICDLLIIKTKVINQKMISCLFKCSNNKYIKGFSSNFYESPVTNYLLNYKKKLKIIAQINENMWNNKKTLQLNILDIIV